LISQYFSHLIVDSEEDKKEKKTKKSNKETPAPTVKKQPVTFVSDSGEGVSKQIASCII